MYIYIMENIMLCNVLLHRDLRKKCICNIVKIFMEMEDVFFSILSVSKLVNFTCNILYISHSI